MVLMAVSGNLLGWTTGASFNDSLVADPVSGIPSCSAKAKVHTSGSEKDAYRKNKQDCEFYCHRWGLLWEGVWKSSSSQCKLGDVSSVSEVTGAGDWAGTLNTLNSKFESKSTRLPTIKELVRIFDYTSFTANDPAFPGDDLVSAGEKGTLFRAWLQKNNSELTYLTGYLISSTYRNIAADGGDVGDASPKILGIEIETGKVVAFDQDLNLCTELTSSGGCAVDDNSDGDNIDKYDVDVYAFKVSELP